MSGIILNQEDIGDINYEGFYDGQNLPVPDNTELTCAVTGGFVGIEEGKSLQVCMINIVITTPGEFFGQKYKYNAKMFDMDKDKRDLASKNLGVLDAQAGFPLSSDRIELTSESIEQYWVGVVEARVKFGGFWSDPEKEENGESKYINFVRAFGYLKDKMVQAGGQQQTQQAQNTQTQSQSRSIEDEFNGDEPDIGFD